MNIGKVTMAYGSSYKEGFTLLELLIVVAMIGILAGIAYPSYQDSVLKSRRTDAYDSLLDCASSQARNFSSQSPSTYFDDSRAQKSNLCGWNGTAFISKDEHYVLTMANTNCLQNNAFWCFTLTATPQGHQAKDTSCATFTLDERGNRTALNSSSVDTTDICWRN